MMLEHGAHRNRWWRSRLAEQSVPAKAMSAAPRSMQAKDSMRTPAASAYAVAFCSACASKNVACERGETPSGIGLLTVKRQC